MALTAARLVTGQTAYAADVKQFYDLLTGAMADQPVTLAELVTCSKATGTGLLVAAGASIGAGLVVGTSIGAVTGSFSGLLGAAGVTASGLLASTADGTGGGFKAGSALDVALYRGAADLWYTGSGDGLLVNGSLEAAGVFRADTSIQVGSGAVVTKLLTGTATWDPGSTADGAANHTSVTVTGAAIGDPVFAGYTSITTDDWLITGYVSGADTVRVEILNKTGGAVDLSSGTVRVIVLHV